MLKGHMKYLDEHSYLSYAGVFPFESENEKTLLYHTHQHGVNT